MKQDGETPDFEMLIPDQQSPEGPIDMSHWRDVACAKWTELVEQIGNVGPASKDIVVRLVISRVFWEIASANSMRLGLVIVSKRGLVANRWASIARQAGEECRKIEKMLGLVGGAYPPRAGKRRFQPRIVGAADKYLNRQRGD